jgi:hypothetical protein
MAPMKGKRWGWIVLGLIVAGAAVFYFMSPTKRQQWIGVVYPDSPGAEAQLPAIRVTEPGEPAPPASGNEDVDLVAKDEPSNISGEVTIGMGFGDSAAPTVDRPVVQTETSIDPAVLEKIGRTLWATLGPIYDPLLMTLEAPKSDMLSQFLIGANPLPELAVPNVHPKTKRIAAAESPDQVGRINSASDKNARFQDLIIQTQTSQNPLLSESAGAVRSESVTSSTQTLTSQPFGTIGSSLNGNSLGSKSLPVRPLGR